MRTGKLLFSKDEERRVLFLAKKLSEALDFEIHLRKYKEALRKRLEEGK